MDDGDHAWVMAARPSPSGSHDPHSVKWSVPSELSLGVYHGVTNLRLGQVRWLGKQGPERLLCRARLGDALRASPKSG